MRNSVEKIKFLTQFKRFFGIKVSLILTIVLILSILVLSIYYYGYTIHKNATDYQVDTNIASVSGSLKDTVSTFDFLFDSLIKISDALAMDFRSYYSSQFPLNDNSSIIREIKNVLKYNNNLYAISVYGPDGMPIAKHCINDNYSAPEYPVNSQLGKDFENGIRDKVYLGTLKYKNSTCLQLSRVYRYLDRYFIIVLELDISFLSRIIYANSIINNGNPILFNGRGQVLYYKNNKPEIYIDTIQFFKQYQNSNGNYFPVKGQGKITSASNYVFHCASDKYDFVLMGIFKSQYIDMHFSYLFKNFFNLTIALILITLVILLLFVFSIYSPVTKIDKAIHSMVSGDFDFNIGISQNKRFYPLASDLNNIALTIRNLINNEYYTKILKKRAELNALQTQINPHFLYNTIDSIRGQALCEGAVKSANMAKILSSVFRYSISNADNFVTLKEELKNVENYMMIQEFRFGNRFKLVIDIIDNDPKIMDFKLLKLLIQPLVENAVIHGLESKPGEGTININICTTDKRMVINIEDNGVGIKCDQLERINCSLSSKIKYTFDNDEQRDKGSIALVNVNERIRISFGEKYGVRLYSTYGVGTNVELILPIIK